MELRQSFILIKNVSELREMNIILINQNCINKGFEDNKKLFEKQGKNCENDTL